MGRNPADDALMARTPDSDPLGKRELRVETAVPESVKGDIGVYWRLLGFNSEAEYVRDLIYKDLYGSFKTVQSIAQRALRVKPGNHRDNPGDG